MMLGRTPLCTYGLAVLLLLSAVVPPAEPVITAAAIAAGAAAISAGTSMVGTTLSALMDNGYRVSCGIDVENWTRFAMTNPIARISSGAVSVPPSAILPSKKEAMVTRKTSDTATGTYGTVSWIVESNPPRRAVIMWSAPYDFNVHSNTLAVGLTSAGAISHVSGNTWFDKMYYNTTARFAYDDAPYSTRYGRKPTLSFTRREYVYDITPVIYQDDKIQIIGTMGSSHKAQVKIQILPIKREDLAGPVKTLLGY